MRKIYISIILLLIITNCYGIKVNETKATQIAVNFIAKNNSYSKNHSFEKIEQKESNGSITYVVKFKPTGFVVVSGDDRYYPVLYYSLESEYDEKNMPDGYKFLMDNYTKEIEFTIKNCETANIKIRSLWEEYSTASLRKTSSTKSVVPLIKTKWHQIYPYNKYCPQVSSSGIGGRAYAGCVAVALAQLMKYYEKPDYGKGSNSYTLSGIGSVSADFTNTYNWKNIVNTLNDENDTLKINETAKLIFHSGVAVSTKYDSVISGAESQMIPEALLNNFFFASASFQSINNSTFSEWLNVLKNELDCQRPIVYLSYDETKNTGHAFIIDGYDMEDYLHVNWGWGGAYDGYYLVTSLTPDEYNFSSNHLALIGAKPSEAVISIIYPANESKNIKKDLTISWDYSLGNRNTQYQLLFSTDEDMKNIIADKIITGDQFYKAYELNYDSIYYLRVGVKLNDSNNSVLWSDKIIFSIEPSLTLKEPSNWSRLISINQVLSWDYRYANENTKYRIWVSKTNDTSGLIKDEIITGNQKYQLDSLDYSSLYYWKVGVYLNNNEIEWTDMASFSTEENPIFMMNLKNPINNSTDVLLTPFFLWSISRYTPNINFQFQLATDNNFSNIVFQKKTADFYCNDVSKLEYNKKYWWRVGVIEADNLSVNWFGMANFTTLISPFFVYNSYPNPFNAATIINFSLVEDGFVNIKIFDYLGREITTIINDKLEIGSYSYRWKPKNLASGIYFFRIKFNNMEKILKLNYLK